MTSKSISSTDSWLCACDGSFIENTESHLCQRTEPRRKSRRAAHLFEKKCMLCTKQSKKVRKSRASTLTVHSIRTFFGCFPLNGTRSPPAKIIVPVKRINQEPQTFVITCLIDNACVTLSDVFWFRSMTQDIYISSLSDGHSTYFQKMIAWVFLKYRQLQRVLGQLFIVSSVTFSICSHKGMRVPVLDHMTGTSAV